MSFSIEQIPSLPLLVNKKQSIHLTDSLLSELTTNQKHLISRLSRFLEFDSAYFDEETNIFIEKLIYFLLPNSSPWINLAELNTLEMVDASNQTSYCFETRADHKTETPLLTYNLSELEQVAQQQDAISKRSQSIRDLFTNKQIILFKEDTSAANILYTLAAFANLLCQYPQWKNNTVLIQICSSQVSWRELEAVPEIVRQINQLYGNPEFVPVHFYHQEIDQDELQAFTNAANITLCPSGSPKESILLKNSPCISSRSVQDPSDIPQLTNALHDALTRSSFN
ncbi:unnamed protein product [Rhizopus microsporus]